MKILRFLCSPRTHSKRTLIGATLALFAAQTFVTAAQAAIGTCNPNRVSYRTAATTDSTTSSTFVPVPYSFL